MNTNFQVLHCSSSTYSVLHSGPAKAVTRRAAAAVAAAQLSGPPAFYRGYGCCNSRNGGVNVAAGAGASAPAGRSREAVEKEARQDAVLRRWIQEHGGFVHDALSISSATQCGARGLVASAAIGLEELEARSLVVVPRSLHLDNRAAVATIAPELGSKAQQEAFRAQLGQLQQVACCLAVERAKGTESFWLPYLRTLPDVPPNPWLLTGGGLEEVLEQAAEAGRKEAAEAEAAAAAAAAAAEAAVMAEAVAEGAPWDEQVTAEARSMVAACSSVGWSAGAGGCRAGWAAAVEAARRRYGSMAEEVLEVVGTDCSRLRLDREGLMWALGQVVSRSLGSGRSSGLLPFIDMANHHSAARPPMMMLDDSDRLVFAVTSIRGGELASLGAGEELFISYQAEDMSPLQAWLKWGFVPHTLA